MWFEDTIGMKGRPTVVASRARKIRRMARASCWAVVVMALCCACPRAHAEQDQPVAPVAPIPAAPASPGYRLGAPPPAAVASPNALAYRSPDTALQLSILSTIIPLVVGIVLLGDDQTTNGLAAIALGLSVGPSVGHIYAGDYGHAIGTAVLRALVGTFGSVEFISAWANREPGSFGDCDDDRPDSCRPGTGQLVLGAALFLVVPVTAVYDIIDAPRAARRANARHVFTNVSLIPIADLRGPAPQQGLALVGQF